MALYTTVYPAALRFFPGWLRSVLAQTDQGFDLWIGLDRLQPTSLMWESPSHRPVRWLRAEPGDTPAIIRGRAMERLARDYEIIVFADVDDLLAADRVEAARRELGGRDVVGCGLYIMDEQGGDLGVRFGPPTGTDACALLPRYNVFGLSNTVYRGAALRASLPLPPDCVLVDWLLATRTWLNGARLSFDPEPRMWYRQYPENIARVVGRFTPRDILTATGLVRDHYRHVLATWPASCGSAWCSVAHARDRVEVFHRAITTSAGRLERYVDALDELPRWYVWWWCVAHPDLEHLWRN